MFICIFLGKGVHSFGQIIKGVCESKKVTNYYLTNWETTDLQLEYKCRCHYIHLIFFSHNRLPNINFNPHPLLEIRFPLAVPVLTQLKTSASGHTLNLYHLPQVNILCFLLTGIIKHIEISYEYQRKIQYISLSYFLINFDQPNGHYATLQSAIVLIL